MANSGNLFHKDPSTHLAFNEQTECPRVSAHHSRVMQRLIFQLADLDWEEGRRKTTCERESVIDLKER